MPVGWGGEWKGGGGGERMQPRILHYWIEQTKIKPNLRFITKTRLFKYIENFTAKKMAIFQIKKSDIFHISAQNIDCGYTLEPPRQGGSNNPQSMFLSRNNKNNVYPCKPQFYYIKVGFKGVKII